MLDYPLAIVTPEMVRPHLPKECPICKEIKPATADFWTLRKDGEPGAMCKACQVTSPGRAQEAAKRACVRGAMNQIVAIAEADRIDVPSINVLCSQMFSLGGGVRGVAEMWWQDIRESKPGSPTRLKQYEVLFKMAAACGEQNLRSVETMSEEELREELVGLVEKHLLKIHDESDGNTAAG